ncbi:MAG TPA: exodeoxyribonuclease VII large subunit [Polyangia bacterium]|nr:exodeoxyribonuclease VII large subunit [Polyangia bacterium]
MSPSPPKKPEPPRGRNLDLFAPQEVPASPPEKASQRPPARTPAGPQRQAAPTEPPEFPSLDPIPEPEVWAPEFVPEFVGWDEALPSPPATPAPVTAPLRRSAPPARGSIDAVALAAPALPARSPTTPQATESSRVYRVSELVRLASRALESRFAAVWVEGEVSNLRVSPGGHFYFTLKDADAQLGVAMFRTEALRLKFRPADGLKLRVRGRLTIYDQQGKFQLQADFAEPAGLGALQLQFEQLKRRLEAEGLFRVERKRRLPFLPRCIGVATSPSGAAVRDIVRVAARRCPVRILIAPCQVQGEAAVGDIVRALRWLDRCPEVELIIVGRGGGSIEDLWAFNDEAVARAIAACQVPVISAVGHEIDFTIADFVADQRAATPSQAAELALPVHAELVARIEDLGARLERSAERVLTRSRQRLDDRAERMQAMMGRYLDGRRAALAALRHRLGELHPRARLGRHRTALERLATRLERPLRERLGQRRQALARLEQRLFTAMHQGLARRHRAFATAAGKLDALSPLRVLDRGYAVVRRPAGEVVTRALALAPGEPLSIQLGDGAVDAVVTAVHGRAPGGDGEGRGGDGEGRGGDVPVGGEPR